MQSATTNETTDNPTQKFLISALNGTVVYTLAYLLVNGLYQAATVAMASRLSLRGEWGLSRVNFSMADNEWWRAAVIGVYGIGPLLAALLGLLVFQRFWQRQRAKRGLLKLLLLWTALHAVNAVLGGLLADTLLKTGFWYVPAWLLRLGNVVNVLLAILAGLVQVYAGYLLAVAFLQAHDSRTVMQHIYRRRMVLTTIFVPWLLGSVLLALAKMPAFSLVEGLHFATLALLLVPMTLGCLNESFSETVPSPRPTRVAWGLLILLALLLLGWRLLLSPPLLFGV